MNVLPCYSQQEPSNSLYKGWRKDGQTLEQVSCAGCQELRREVNDLRTTFNLLIPTLYSAANGLGAAVPVANLFQPQQSQAASVPQAISTSDDALAVQNAVRKRSAAPPSPTTQPECPVSIGVLNQTNPFVFPHWMMAPLRAQSPALPTANITMPVTGIQVPSADEQAVKWSSPSSVDSNGQKTDSSIVSESQNIDIVGDGSESSTSSASAQEPIAQSFYQAVQNTAQQQVVQALLNCDGKSFYSNAQAIDNAALRVAPAPSSSAIKPATVAATIGPERKPRKPVNDDIVKIVRQQDLSAEAISKIEIPVPQALQSEPTFRPVSEQQIIQQIIQGKKYEEKDVGECMIQLCKKLAEKRVFGPRLMSQTTVAGLNHSNYSNLPIQGICYIQHICWKVLRDKFNHDEDFWDKFREAMRKLAARCRRVRHAKKTKSHREESLAQQELLQKRFGEDLPQSLSHTIHSLGLTALQPKPEIGFETLLSSDMHKVQIGQLLNTLGTLKMKDRQAAQEAVAQSLLQLANNGDFTVKSESLSPV